MRDVEITDRIAFEPGMTSTQWREGNKLFALNVHEADALGTVRVTFEHLGSTSVSLQLPEQIARLLIGDLREAVDPTPIAVPEIPNDTPLGFAFNRALADLNGRQDEAA